MGRPMTEYQRLLLNNPEAAAALMAQRQAAEEEELRRRQQSMAAMAAAYAAAAAMGRSAYTSVNPTPVEAVDSMITTVPAGHPRVPPRPEPRGESPERERDPNEPSSVSAHD